MEKPKILVRGKEARRKIRKAINEVADTVRVTLGPGGRNALIDRDWRTPRITNDGVFIAGNISPDDEIEAIATHAFVQAARKTNEKVGDGTTTSIVLAQKIINDCFDRLDSNDTSLIEGGGNRENAMQMSRDIMSEAEKVIKEIKKVTRKTEGIDDLIDVATVSMESREHGKMVAEMVEKVGVHGFIDVTEGFHGKVETEIIEGMKIRGKTPAPFMITNPNRMLVEVEDVSVVVTNMRLDNPAELAGLTQPLHQRGVRKLVIFCENVTEEVMMDVYKAWQAGFKIFILKYPSLTTEEIEDVAVYCGGKFFNRHGGDTLHAVKPEDIGKVERVIADESDIMIVGGSGNAEERIKILKDQIHAEKDNRFKLKLKRRIASIASGIGVIRAGAASEVEAGYLKLKFEDAVNATQAALEEGVVEGGGLCLKKIAEKLPKSILTEALKAPYEQNKENNGGSLKIDKHIIDPAKVERLAVENACSVAGTMITTESVIADKRDRSEYDGLNKVASALIMDDEDKTWIRNKSNRKIGRDDDYEG